MVPFFWRQALYCADMISRGQPQHRHERERYLRDGQSKNRETQETLGVFVGPSECGMNPHMGYSHVDLAYLPRSLLMRDKKDKHSIKHAD
jgi:hypothetical protein